MPVFLTGQWQDEQTGPHFATMLDKFTGAPIKRFFVTNGVHVDGLAPQNLMEWFIFLELYVAERVPQFDEGAASLVPVFFSQVFGAFIAAAREPLGRGRARLRDRPRGLRSRAPLRVVFETGTAEGLRRGRAPGGVRGILRRLAHPRDRRAAPVSPARWHPRPRPPPAAEDAPATRFHPEPAAGDRTTLPEGQRRALQPAYVYPALTDEHAVAWIGSPLAADTVMVGSGSVDLWLKSTETDADLEVNLTEVRPDGQEVLVQSGWLRASQRKLRADATELRPVKTHYLADIEPLVPGEWTPLRVEIMPFAHVFRAGSRAHLGRHAGRQPRRLALHPSGVLLPTAPVPSAQHLVSRASMFAAVKTPAKTSKSTRSSSGLPSVMGSAGTAASPKKLP